MRRRISFLLHDGYCGFRHLLSNQSQHCVVTLCPTNSQSLSIERGARARTTNERTKLVGTFILREAAQEVDDMHYDVQVFRGVSIRHCTTDLSPRKFFFSLALDEETRPKTKTVLVILDISTFFTPGALHEVAMTG